MKIIGIDPGLSGAIAILQNNKVLGLFKCNTKVLLENIKENKVNYNFCNQLKIA